VAGISRATTLYSAFIKNAFLEMLAYRLRYVTGILTYLLFVSVHYFIWKAIYAGRAADEAVNGFTLSEMVTYITVGWIARSFYFSNIDEEIDEIVRTGQVGIYLIRPVNFQLMLLAKAVGSSLFRIVFFATPISVVLLYFFPVSPPEKLEHFLLFVAGTAMGFLVLAQINFLVGLLAFAFKSIRGVVRAKYYVIQLASGLLLPLAFFPDWLESALDFLPFKYIAYTPLTLYLGKYEASELGSLFLVQLAWLLGLLVVGWWLWKRALGKLTVQGG